MHLVQVKSAGVCGAPVLQPAWRAIWSCACHTLMIKLITPEKWVGALRWHAPASPAPEWEVRDQGLGHFSLLCCKEAP
jgi:hypothetical protein